MTGSIKTILIGLFVLGACALVIYMLLFLHPVSGNQKEFLRVRFANVDKINKGTRVTYGGRPVGEVLEIRNIEDDKEARKPGKDGFIYLYELKLGVDSRVRVYNTDEIASRTSGLLGEKNIEITPVAPKPGEEVFLVNDRILYAKEGGTVEETLKEFKELSDKIDGTLDSFKFAIDELNRQKIWEKMSRTIENVESITESFNEPDKLKDILENAHRFSKAANLTAKHFNDVAVRASHVMEDVGHLIDETGGKFNHVLNNLAAITNTVSQGQGTLGRILMRDDIYLRTASLMSKGETILDDINHFGILFHNDKRWQRMRARRANLITRLCTPMEFRNFFNDELGEITASLSRLSRVLQETESNCCYQSFMDDCEFRKAFAELLRRVNMMQESLKLYNQQVVEKDACETEIQVER